LADRFTVVRDLEQAGVIAVIRLEQPSELRPVVDALLEGGIRALEVTMTVPGAVSLIDTLAASLPPTAIVGAGTVVDADTARQVIDAGARFVVSPVFRPALIESCHERGVPAMPGCFTPTEILDAWESGADLVKVFPATSLGPGFIKDIRGPLPQLRLVPTGGVTRENAGDWIRAGAVAIGVGSALVDRKAVAARRFDLIRVAARGFVDAVQSAREGEPSSHAIARPEGGQLGTASAGRSLQTQFEAEPR
jgi:2-dehydro-3-deoxyphosphogluconate aldolase/(4S)-4-hydroxy-2-oxoglutarate aldolase